MTVRSISLPLVVLALTGCGQLSSPLGPDGEMATVIGVVESVDISPMAYDGPAEVQIRSQEHGLVHVYVSACMGPCALEAVNALDEMQPGQVWQATGEISGDHELAVYEPASHGLDLVGARQ